MTKKWMDVKGEIERRYLIQKIPLKEVRQQMLKEHGFVASTRAYKDKFKEWGWKTYRKTCDLNLACAQNRVSRSRPRRKPSSTAKSVQARLKNQHKNIECQTSLAVRERNELRALRDSLEDKLAYYSTAEKVNQTMGGITKLEQTIHAWRKNTEEIEKRRNTPSGFASCWKQDPMTLEDALGRLFMIPLDIVVSWETFEEHLESLFQICPGAKKVQRREYAIEDGLTRTAFSRSRPWSLFSRPGRMVEMSMIFKGRSNARVVCPTCNTISQEKKGTLIKWHVIATGVRGIPMLIYAHLLTGNAEDEEDEEEEEEMPSLFKRVIIRVAKIPLLPQSVKTLNSPYRTNPLLPRQGIPSPRHDIFWQTLVEYNPLEPESPFDLLQTLSNMTADMDRYIVDLGWTLQNPSIDSGVPTNFLREHDSTQQRRLSEEFSPSPNTHSNQGKHTYSAVSDQPPAASFAGGLGGWQYFSNLSLDKAQNMEYVAQEPSLEMNISLAAPWEYAFQPDRTVNMGMVFRGPQSSTSSCPGCGTENVIDSNNRGSEIQCSECNMWYQRIVELDAAAQPLHKPAGFSHVVESPWRIGDDYLWIFSQET
ncbi:hypothetical protein OIDMADRAFT_27555 [Oidiodendron maius Zn]|uniref:Uncharacterized protein n=1 Tax=Oidiodendron maius (strain Zn) TaxID=913774 RepID=A0A0C3HJ75_OIDMZ|nr:hypothetical protein OIDMADRAFT_27555 [Oidiodendron maius Zn]